MKPGEVLVRLPSIDQLLPPAARESILRRLAVLAMRQIRARTTKGVDVDGHPFAPYSARYSAQRRLAGRRVAPVQLALTGQMLASMTILRANGKEAVIGFAGSSARARFAKRARATKTRDGARSTHTFAEQAGTVANALKARWNDGGEGKAPKRHFFGLSQEERRALAQEARKRVLVALRSRGGASR